VDILFLLIPMSSVLVLAIVGVFAWALARGQFDDLEHEGGRILDEAQTTTDAPPEQSPASPARLNTHEQRRPSAAHRLHR
jgi:cbb3-type cytochrome oxidase maturation protein